MLGDKLENATDRVAYEREIDLDDRSVFPIESFYAQPENPGGAVSRKLSFEKLTDDELIDFTVKTMEGTLG